MFKEVARMRALLSIVLLLISLSACSHKVHYTQPTFIPPEEIVYMSPSPMHHPKRTVPLIVIDAGHGGDDEGTVSPTKPSYKEKFLTLSTARLLNQYLLQMGYKTKMTRDQDVFIPLKTRSDMANSAEPTLFVSVHYNSAPSKEAHGIEVFYYSAENPRSKASKELASYALQGIIEKTNAKSRGVKAGNYAVIRETTMPAILIEGGFLTNQDELQKIKDPTYLKRLAFGIAQGIDQYIKLNQS